MAIMGKVDKADKRLIVIDREYNHRGFEDKEKCHDGDGILHLAYLVTIFSDRGDVLLTKRYDKKRLWPGFWDASVASHVLACDTSYTESAERRVVEEIGVKPMILYSVTSLEYFAKYGDRGSEREVLLLYAGKIDENSMRINGGEISDHKWVRFDELFQEIRAQGQEIKRVGNVYTYVEKPEVTLEEKVRYTPWLRMAVKHLKEYLSKSKGLTVSTR